MENTKTLSILRKFIETIPSAGKFSGSPDQLQIIGQAISSLKEYKNNEFFLTSTLGSIQGRLGSAMMRQDAITELISIVHGTITELENLLSLEIKRVYGPGATYDFYVNFKTLVASATTALLLVDPYINDELFELYVSKVTVGVQVRILTNQNNFPSNLLTIIGKYKQQLGPSITLRDSKNLHDRVVFIDSDQCWVLGQSIKDAAKKKPTYLAPLPIEIIPDKLQFYEDIWAKATII